MGNVLSGNKKAKQEPKPADDAEKDSSDEEANRFIDVRVTYQLPSGTTTSTQTIHADPGVKVSVFKKDLAHLLRVDENSIEIDRGHGTRTLMDNHTLEAMGVKMGSEVRVTMKDV